MDSNRDHTEAGISNFHSAAQGAVGCDSSGPVDRRGRNTVCHEVDSSQNGAQNAANSDSSRPVYKINSSPANEVDDVPSAAQNAMSSDSSGSGEREHTLYVHTDINDAYGAAQDILGCDPSQPGVEREDNGSSVSIHSNNSSLSVDSDLSGSGLSGPVDREEGDPDDSNDSHTEDEDGLSCASSEPVERQDSNSVNVDSSDSAQGAQGSSKPENGGDSNYIHTEINDSYGAVQDALGY